MTVLAERPVTAAPATTAGALAIRAEQTMWTPEQAAVLRQSGIGESVTNAELAGFLHLCQRTGLDPFSRQIYLIGRWDRRAGREVFTPQTGIDGYRVVARRATVKGGGSYGYEDTLWCDTDGRWRDVWLSDEPPAAAKVTVVRDGQRFSAVARYSEYVQTGKEDKPIGMWRKMPASQLAKCCEALALRRAFPHDLAGVYTAEEMAQADNPQPEPRLQRQASGQDAWEQATPAAGPGSLQAPAAAGAAPLQQTPPDVVADIPAESLTPNGRDYLHEAHAAPDAATVRQIWQDARTEGARPEYLEQIAAVGKARAAAAEAADQAPQGPTPSTAGSGTAAGRATERATESPTPEQAEERLRIAASRAHLTTVDQDFHAVYGLPIDQATAGQLNAFADRIEAAGGQQ